MQVTQSNLNYIFNAFDIRFQLAYQGASPWYQQVATEVPSKTTQQTYAWMAKLPRLREWLGERVAQNVATYGYVLVNKDYELTEKLDRNMVEDDSVGLFNPIVDEMGLQSRLWPDDLMTILLEGGENTLCFDGQNFFDVDHPVDRRKPELGTQQNFFPNTPLTSENYAKVRSAMMSFRGEDQKPLYVVPKLLVVPPQLEQVGRLILNADMIPNVQGTAPQTNVYKGSAELLVVPQLSIQPTSWYLLDVSRPIKPFVFQLREAPQFTYLNNPNDLNVFQRREYLFGVHARGNAGYALWFLAAKGVG
ncbi:Mu-like prophage major head subunit gpT family protein [Pendulispora brunnea]|uniref:Mu-like prophage major head subunit gpT family protein n=1 Tax=Pendulispora brunnea TaxID=2905690 RepID=A0ABZ2KCF7_9BACT